MINLLPVVIVWPIETNDIRAIANISKVFFISFLL